LPRNVNDLRDLKGGKILAKKQDKQTVLVVDDEPIIRESLRLMLEKSGFEVTMAEDGEQALDIVKK
jgi:CheY-like chemotaxis protein